MRFDPAGFFAALPRTWRQLSRRGRVGAVVLVVLAAGVLAFPVAGGAVAQRLLARAVANRLGGELRLGRARTGLVSLRLDDVAFAARPGARPIATAAAITVPYSAAWGAGTVVVDRARVMVAPEDLPAIDELRQRLRGPRPEGRASPGEGARRRPGLVIHDGRLRFDGAGHHLAVASFDVDLQPGKSARVALRELAGRLHVRGNDADPGFEAEDVRVEVPLEGLRPAGAPRLQIKNGSLELLPTLPLTGIAGTIGPDEESKTRGEATPTIVIALHGSYGGARETLWDATGRLRPGPDLKSSAGQVSLRAARFSLDRVADILPDTILAPANTSIDAALDVSLEAGLVKLGGLLEIDGLSFHHPRLASEPVFDVAGSAKLDATIDVAQRRLDLALFEGRLRDLVGRVSGFVQLAPGSFKFKDGSSLSVLPHVDLTMTVPKLPCSRALGSIPGPLVPKLQGFDLKGTFEANLHAKVDFANLDDTALEGKVGIDGCSVVKAPSSVESMNDEAIAQIVEVPAGPKGEPGETETLVFIVGPDNPDFVPIDKISKHVINSILTTEDGGFFKHHGFVTSEFKTALKRNLERGAFGFGASSITMQMVKNLLLSQEKTLSRKLQELFLVWYLEQRLPKERILELYLNAIEFGPRIYGIGAAAKHYFGKSATDLTPIEAVFFSSILPSPKRRYEHYCHGQISQSWDKYLRRILTRMHERGRLTDEEFEESVKAPFMFDLTAREGNEKQCVDWIKRITATSRPEPEVPLDSE